MIRVYNDSYLNSTKVRLAQMLDYLINDCRLDADWTVTLFLTSGYAAQFERRNPSVVAGMSGIEIARNVIRKTYQEKELPAPGHSQDRSPEYWAGWALAEYQWKSGRRFEDIFSHIVLTDILRMYPRYHEMDISHFIERMEEICSKKLPESRLGRLRKNRGLSQSELAGASGVSLRSIQMYEQRVNDIDKAQAQTLYKLSRVIGCRIEDLLEHPLK